MENRPHAFVAGLFVIFFGLAVVVAVWWFGGARADTRDLVLVTQGNVNGLNPFAQVRFRGISAGKVIGIGLDPEDTRNILVHIRVDASLPLTKGTTAQLSYQGLTGLTIVQLEDNGKNRELLTLNDGTLPRISIQPSLLDSLGDRANDIFTHVGELSANLNRLLDERNLRNLNQTLENVATASQGLKEMPQIIASIKSVLSDENIQRLHDTLEHLERTAGETEPLTAEMRALVGSMQNVSKRFDEMTVKVGGEFSGTTLPHFNTLLIDLQNNSRQINRVLNELETSPQSIVFGRPRTRPGPGESGFVNTGK